MKKNNKKTDKNTATPENNDIEKQFERSYQTFVYCQEQYQRILSAMKNLNRGEELNNLAIEYTENCKRLVDMVSDDCYRLFDPFGNFKHYHNELKETQTKQWEQSTEQMSSLIKNWANKIAEVESNFKQWDEINQSMASTLQSYNDLELNKFREATIKSLNMPEKMKKEHEKINAIIEKNIDLYKKIISEMSDFEKLNNQFNAANEKILEFDKLNEELNKKAKGINDIMKKSCQRNYKIFNDIKKSHQDLSDINPQFKKFGEQFNEMFNNLLKTNPYGNYA